MKKLPLQLIYMRLLFSGFILALAFIQPPYFRATIITLIIAGSISDVFDGIIARRLNVSTERLRRLDSSVDQVFWLSIVAGCFIIHPNFFKSYWIELMLLVIAECTCYMISYLKFRKEVATHAIASKMWTLVLFATLIQVIATGNSPVLFYVCFYLGLLTRFEIIGMLLIIKQWTNDIPTVYHAYLIRHNKLIKRHKLFNG